MKQPLIKTERSIKENRFLDNKYTATVTYDFKGDRKSTRLNSSHTVISYAVFCLKKKKKIKTKLLSVMEARRT